MHQSFEMEVLMAGVFTGISLASDLSLCGLADSKVPDDFPRRNPALPKALPLPCSSLSLRPYHHFRCLETIVSPGKSHVSADRCRCAI